MPARFDPSVLFYRRSANFALALVTAVAVITSVTSTTRARWNKSDSAVKQDDSARLEPVTKKEPAAVQDYPEKRFSVARITLSRKGFAPAEITRPQGPFILSIHNRTKIDDLTLSLAKASENKLREMNFRGRKLDWRSFITLPPGDYTLSVAGRPEWVCKVKIKEN